MFCIFISLWYARSVASIFDYVRWCRLRDCENGKRNNHNNACFVWVVIFSTSGCVYWFLVSHNLKIESVLFHALNMRWWWVIVKMFACKGPSYNSHVFVYIFFLCWFVDSRFIRARSTSRLHFSPLTLFRAFFFNVNNIDLRPLMSQNPFGV